MSSFGVSTIMLSSSDASPAAYTIGRRTWIVIMPFGLFAMLLMPLGLEHYPLVAMAWGLDRMLDIARFVTSLDGEIVTGRIGHLGFVLIATGGVLVCVLRSWLALSGALLICAGLVSLAVERDRLPDVVIAEDGRLIGLVANGAIATNSCGGSLGIGNESPKVFCERRDFRSEPRLQRRRRPNGSRDHVWSTVGEEQVRNRYDLFFVARLLL